MRILFPDVSPVPGTVPGTEYASDHPRASTHPKVHLFGFREGWNLGVGGRVARALTVAARPPSHPCPLPGSDGRAPLAPTGDLSPVVDTPPVESLDSRVDSGAGELVWPQLLALAR